MGINNFGFTKTLPTGLFQGFPAAHTELDFHVQRISKEAKLNHTTEQKNGGVLGKEWRLGENSRNLGGLGWQFYWLVWQSEVPGFTVDLTNLLQVYSFPQGMQTQSSPFGALLTLLSLMQLLTPSLLFVNTALPPCSNSHLSLCACWLGRTGLLAAGMGEKGDSSNCFWPFVYVSPNASFSVLYQQQKSGQEDRNQSFGIKRGNPTLQ